MKTVFRAAGNAVSDWYRGNDGHCDYFPIYIYIYCIYAEMTVFIDLDKQQDGMVSGIAGCNDNQDQCRR